MAERTAPGVYVEEKPAAPGAIQGVTTSNLALIGFTKKGTINKPILVTSYSDFERKFGGFTEKGLTPLEAFAFFSNGGRRLYVVRITSSDAEKSSGYLAEESSGESLVDGNGAVVNGDGSASYQLFTAKTPVIPGTFQVVAGSVTFTDDGDGGLVASGGSGGSGSIDYLSGEVNLQFNDGTDWSANPSSATYSYGTFKFDMKWPGVAGDDFRVVIKGSPDYEQFDSNGRALAQFSRFIILVEEYVNNEWQVLEQFDDIDFTDSASKDFISTVLNDDNAGSDYIEVTDYGNNESPSVLAGTQKTAQSIASQSPAYDGSEKEFLYKLSEVVYSKTLTAKFKFLDSAIIGTGDGTASPSVQIPGWVNDGSFALEAGDGTGIGGSKVQVDFELDTGGATSAYDDGAGKLTSDGTPSGTQYGTVDYTTGAIAINISGDTVKSGTPITLVAAEYQKTVDVIDDGNGNMDIDSNSAGPIARFMLNSNGENKVTYSNTDTPAVTEFTLTWQIYGNPGAGPAGVSATNGQVADYYTVPASEINKDLSGGTDGSSVTSNDIIGASLAANYQGLWALDLTDEILNVVISDFQTDEIVGGALIDYCEGRKDRFAILTVPEGYNEQEAVNWRKSVLNKNSSFAAAYWPHITVIDPLQNKAINIPCGGHIAGIFARTDQNKNVAKAPAGVEDGALSFAIGLEMEPTFEQVGYVYQNKINALVNWPHTGLVVWGARTLEAAGGEFPYIQQRRLFMFLEKSIFNASHVFVFEDNNEGLWARIRFQVTNFLLGLFNGGYFPGTRPSDAFFVICDSTNNTQVTIDQGLVFCDVGVATNKPGEFIVFRFTQKIQS